MREGSIYDFDEDKKRQPSQKGKSGEALSVQTLFDCEKHYLEMVKNYRSEIEFMEHLWENFREEQVRFYEESLPKIEEVLNKNQEIDPPVKMEWLGKLTANMQRSFDASEKLIRLYTTKSLEDFKRAVDEQLHSL